jgi:hypothetical protein
VRLQAGSGPWLTGPPYGVEAREENARRTRPVVKMITIEYEHLARQRYDDRLGDARRERLAAVARANGGDPDAVRRLRATAVAERLARLRTGERLTGSPHLSRLLETELLSLGVEGKLLLWRTLRAGWAEDPRLRGIDLNALIARANAQRRRLERERLKAAGELA